MELFEVGGCVRDELMGRKSNDIDFSVVLSDSELPDPARTVNPPTPFAIMVNNLNEAGFKIFVETPQHLTVRAQFPKSEGKALTADFVLARKEGTYTDGRRPDSVEVGTLEDDLARRDFRMNAIARSMTGEIVDPFNGRQDINERVIRAVGSAHERLKEDALRAVRALRFHVTLGFRIDHEVQFAMQSYDVLDNIKGLISDERIKDELNKMLKVDTLESIRAMNRFPLLTEAMLGGSVWLQATMKER